MEPWPSHGAVAPEDLASDTIPLFRHRLVLCAAFPALFLGLAALVLLRSSPERSTAVSLGYAAELAMCGAAILLAHHRALERHLAALAFLFSLFQALFLLKICGILHLPAEVAALALACELMALSALLPWGWFPQTGLGAIVVSGFALVAPSLPHHDTLPLAVVSLVAAATGSIVAALLLERYRVEARTHALDLRRESLRTAEELDISTTLLRVTEALSAGLGRKEILAEVNRIAVEVLGVEWSATFLLDDAIGDLRLATRRDRSSHDPNLDPPPILQAIDWPIFDRLSSGNLVEIDDADEQALVPPEVLRERGIGSALFVPVVSNGHAVGVLASGYRERRGPFSPRQRRVLLGLAHASSIAIENERLVGRLQAANRLKSDFVSTMSHELRTPLNVITGYAEILRDPELGRLSPEHASAAEGIARNAAQLLELVTATLDLARLEAGREPLDLERVRVREVFSEVDAELAPLRRSDEVHLSWEAPGATARDPISDRRKLKTIVKNLVGNALKFTRRGEIRVTARSEPGALVIAVRDTGIGIAKGDREAIFEMFRQIDASTTSPFEGVGLGLHIVKRLTERLGGSVELESTPDVGSTFTVRIPDQGVTSAST